MFSVNLSLFVYWFEDNNVMIKFVIETLSIEEFFDFIIFKARKQASRKQKRI
jgi:hypothetical protein